MIAHTYIQCPASLMFVVSLKVRQRDVWIVELGPHCKILSCGMSTHLQTPLSYQVQGLSQSRGLFFPRSRMLITSRGFKIIFLPSTMKLPLLLNKAIDKQRIANDLKPGILAIDS